MFDLVFLSGVRAGAVVQVTESMVAGRSPDCDIEVPDPNASRAHIRFEWMARNCLWWIMAPPMVRMSTSGAWNAITAP